MPSAPAAGSTPASCSRPRKGTLLVDCGASAPVALKAHGLDPNRIDGIVLSHLHGDHFGGLPFLCSMPSSCRVASGRC